MLTERAELAARLSLDDQFSKKLKGIQGSVSKGASALVDNVVKIGAAAAVGFAGVVAMGVRSLSELSTLQQQTNAVITSTGGVAKVSAQQVRDLANALEDVTTVDDKVIQSGQNMLLTFTNIGSDIFPRATKAMTDMAIAMNGGSTEGLDLKATAIQIGKALQDPIKGATALRRVGVALTDQQEKQIKSLVKQGRLQEAQVVILKELETEFGKAGEAAGKDFGSDLRRLQDVGEDLTQALAKGLMPVISTAAKWLKDKLTDPAVLARVQELGAELATAGKELLGFLDKVDWYALAKGLGQAKDAAGGIVSAFMAMPDWVKQLLIGGFVANKLTGGALGSIVGALGSGLIKGVLGLNAGVVNINAGVVNGGGGGVGGAAKGGILGAAATVVPLVALGAGLGLLVAAVRNKVSGDTGNAASDAQARVAAALAKSPTFQEMTGLLAGVDKGIAEINEHPAFDIIGGREVVAKLEESRAAIIAAQVASTADARATQQVLNYSLQAQQAAAQVAPTIHITVPVTVTARAVQQAEEEYWRSGAGSRLQDF